MKSTNTKWFSTLIAATLILLAAVTAVLAQVVEPKTLKCDVCKFENEWSYKFCTNCGASLATMKETRLAELERESARQKAAADSLAKAREAEAKRRQQEAAAAAQATNAASARDTSRRDLLASARAMETARTVPPRNHSAATPSAQDKPEKQGWYKTMLKEPAILPRLFNVPTASVLGSLDLYFTGGGAFGIEKERNFLGRAGMGLGDVAEVEFATQSVINSLQHGSSSLPTSAFKMLIMRERDGLPAVAAALRGTTSWQLLSAYHATGFSSFETRFTKLYFVASKRVNKISGHVGMGLTDVRVRNGQTETFVDGTPATTTKSGELQRNLWAPFGGLSIQANPKTLVMLEIEGLPSYDFEEGHEFSKERIKNIWAGVVGVRFYFTNWMAADTGVRYRSDFDGIADANIQASLNLLLPVGRLRESRKTHSTNQLGCSLNHKEHRGHKERKNRRQKNGVCHHTAIVAVGRRSSYSRFSVLPFFGFMSFISFCPLCPLWFKKTHEYEGI